MRIRLLVSLTIAVGARRVWIEHEIGCTAKAGGSGEGTGSDDDDAARH